MSDAFLGVERSALGRRWVSRLDRRGENLALALAQRSGLSDVVARVLAGRGVTDAGTVPAFIEPRLRDLMPDPATMTDCAEAAKRLARAVRAAEPVAVFGDYDVDGAASAAIVSRVLRALGCPVEVYIPDRLTEGYGPTEAAIGALIDRGARLIVTVDCGVASHGPIALARARDVDCIVLDHHQTGPDLPDAVAVVDPNRQDDLSGLGYLCAAGVAFMAMVALRRELAGTDFPDLLKLLDLVALATVCDVVPLVGLNRAFVVRGLDVMGRNGNVGLQALRRIAGLKGPPDVRSLGFALGPRINAGGRVGDASLGAKLLAERDPTRADEIAGLLDTFNRERQHVESDVLRAALDEAASEMGRAGGPSILVTADDGWHPGVVGLVASRLRERFDRPAFAIGFDGSGRGTGSGRSVPTVDIGRLVRSAADAGIIEKGGGHAMAAGLTVRRERLGELRDFLQRHLPVEGASPVTTYPIDAAVTAGAAGTDLIAELERAGPFGAGHPQPTLALPDHVVADARLVGRGHVAATLRGATGTLRAIAFRAADGPVGELLTGSIGQPVHVAGTLDRDDYRGRNGTVLRVDDAARP